MEGALMPYALCLFCGGPSDPGHGCDGRQGWIEAQEDDLPLLIAGIVPETWDTSAAAAVSIESAKDTQRALVFSTIRSAGISGRTDDELQDVLGLDGSSERPRRWELWKLGLIDILRDDDGAAIRRLTRTNRRAVVWVAVAQREVA
jgi:hypothetical protein